MAWTGTVFLDEDKADVGLAVATWDKGLPAEFTYSRRARMNVTDKNAFVTEAKAALVSHQTLNTSEANLSAILTTALNA